VAPDKFHGNLLGAYGRSFQFQLSRIRVADIQFDNRDVIFKGNDSLIWYKIGLPSVYPIWTDYSIDITYHEDGWKLDNDERASKEDIRNVLSNVSNIYIRGEYDDGGDECGLDNVVLC
jgi:hypothetical protein